MPQLDLVVYYPQFLWFSLGFSLFYLIVIYKIIPVVAFSLKYRKKKIFYIHSFIDNKKLHSFESFYLYFTIIGKVLQISRLYLIKLNLNVVKFISLNYMSVNTLFFKFCNKNLLKKLMSLYLSFIKIKVFLS